MKHTWCKWASIVYRESIETDDINEKILASNSNDFLNAYIYWSDFRNALLRIHSEKMNVW